MTLLFLSLALASSKTPLYYVKSEFLDHLNTKCHYRELTRGGKELTIIKEGTIYSCPKVIYYDPLTDGWSESP